MFQLTNFTIGLQKMLSFQSKVIRLSSLANLTTVTSQNKPIQKWKPTGTKPAVGSSEKISLDYPII